MYFFFKGESYFVFSISCSLVVVWYGFVICTSFWGGECIFNQLLSSKSLSKISKNSYFTSINYTGIIYYEYISLLVTLSELYFKSGYAE